jgi:hypothetical protein
MAIPSSGRDIGTPPSSRRKPKGYLGQRHETIGSDILSVARILRNPEQVLDERDRAHLASVRPDGWYPIEWLLSMMEKLDQSVGHFGLVRMGRTLFEMSHQERVKAVAQSARDIIFGLDGMYHHANRGVEIGGWNVLRFEPGYAELEKNTPHHCVMEQGIIAGALTAVGCPSNVTQSQCFRDGGPNCVFVVSSALTDTRWDHLAK